MPAYSYKERFILLILDGSKNQTIRKRREKGYAKAGDTLYHYYGLRTKHCRKLGESICREVKTIMIKKDGTVILYNHRLSDEAVRKAMRGNLKGNKIAAVTKSQLAWHDGFRVGRNGKYSIKNWIMMFHWWAQTHELPFIGDLIMWDKKTFTESLTARVCPL